MIFLLGQEFWVDITRIAPCANETCDGGSLVWNDNNSNFALSDTNGLIVQVDAEGEDCLRYKEIGAGMTIQQGFFDTPCNWNYDVMCTKTCQ